MIEFFNANPHTFWFGAGFALLVIEALAFGFTSGVLLFAAIGALSTGTLIWIGLLPASWGAGIGSFGLCSALSAMLLWKPLLKLQNGKERPPHDLSSDFIGHEFRLGQTITYAAPGKTQYSGIEWRVEIDDSAAVGQIEAGTKVAVASIDVGVFRVRPAGGTGSE